MNLCYHSENLSFLLNGLFIIYLLQFFDSSLLIHVTGRPDYEQEQEQVHVPICNSNEELHLEEYGVCRACKLVTPLVELFVEQEHHCIACYL